MTVYSSLLPSFGSGMCLHTFNGGRGFLSDRDVNGTLICPRFLIANANLDQIPYTNIICSISNGIEQFNMKIRDNLIRCSVSDVYII